MYGIHYTRKRGGVNCGRTDKTDKNDDFLLALTALFLVTAVSVRLLTPRAAASAVYRWRP